MPKVHPLSPRSCLPKSLVFMNCFFLQHTLAVAMLLPLRARQHARCVHDIRLPCHNA